MALIMPRPQSGGLIISYTCNIECRHCYLRCSSRKGGQMTYENATRYLADFKKAGVPQEEIHISGGEPFLNIKYLSGLLDSARLAGYSGFGFVETNASWAISDEICARRLNLLKEKGVGKLCVSADIFHQEFVPIANVKRLLYFAEQILGENSVVLRWRKGLDQSKHIGQMSREDFLAYVNNPQKEFRVRVVGRGLSALAPLLPKKSLEVVDSSPCFNTIIGKGHYHFDPHQNLVPGIGCVIFGNATNRSLEEVISEISEKNNPIFTWLAQEGPKGKFLEFAKFKGYSEHDEGYYDKCHLCFDIRNWLAQSGLNLSEIGPPEAFSE